MTGVVAVVGSASPFLAETGAAVARLLGADVRHLRVRRGRDAPEAVRAVLDELAGRDVLAAVMPGGGAMGATTGHVISASRKPIVVTPPMLVTRHPLAISRVLMPLDGSAEAAAAVAPTVELLADAGVDVVAMHVFDQATVPRFWDQAAHARSCWESEFRARYCPHPGVRLQLRTGAPAEQVVRVAEHERVDLIVLGWSQRLSADRAATVRRTMSEAHVPVMLMPVSTGVRPPRQVLDAGSGMS